MSVQMICSQKVKLFVFLLGKSRSWLWVCFGGMVLVAQAQPVKIAVSKKAVVLGESFQVWIQVSGLSSEASISFTPDWKNIQLRSFQDTYIGDGNQLTLQRTYQAMLLEPGPYTFIPQPLTLHTDTHLHTPELTILCEPLPVSQPDLHLSALSPPPYSWYEWWPYIAALAALLGLTIGWEIYRKWRWSGSWNLSQKPAPSKQARQALAKWHSHSTEPDAVFYKALYDILTTYLTQKYQLPHTPGTATEYLQQLQGNTSIDPAQLVQLDVLLQMLTQKRFAQPETSTPDREQLFTQVKNWIQDK